MTWITQVEQAEAGRIYTLKISGHGEFGRRGAVRDGQAISQQITLLGGEVTWMFLRHLRYSREGSRIDEAVGSGELVMKGNVDLAAVARVFQNSVEVWSGEDRIVKAKLYGRRPTREEVMEGLERGEYDAALGELSSSTDIWWYGDVPLGE